MKSIYGICEINANVNTLKIYFFISLVYLKPTVIQNIKIGAANLPTNPIIPGIMSITMSLISSSLPGNKIAKLSAIATHSCQGIILGIWSINIEMIAIIFNLLVFIIIPLQNHSLKFSS